MYIVIFYFANYQSQSAVLFTSRWLIKPGYVSTTAHVQDWSQSWTCVTKPPFKIPLWFTNLSIQRVSEVRDTGKNISIHFKYIFSITVSFNI